MNINPNIEPIQPQAMSSKKCERMVSQNLNAPKKKKTRSPSFAADNTDHSWDNDKQNTEAKQTQKSKQTPDKMKVSDIQTARQTFPLKLALSKFSLQTGRALRLRLELVSCCYRPGTSADETKNGPGCCIAMIASCIDKLVPAQKPRQASLFEAWTCAWVLSKDVLPI